jgi:sugar phosphate permease
MEKEEEHLAPKELILRVMNNRLLWYVCLGNMFLYAVRMGIFNWAPTFLKEMTGASLVSSGLQLSGYELAGIPGGFIAGWASDRFFSGRRGPVSVVYMALLTACLFYFWWVPASNLAMNACVMMAVGFLVYGPQVLAGVAAADFASKKAVGMANGLTGTFGYLGSALSGLCVGRIADHYGWSGGFVFFIAASFLATFFFSLTWNHRAKILEEQAEAHIE